MANKNRRRSYNRNLPSRRYRIMFYIAAEGKVTERQYFDGLNSEKSIFHIQVIKRSGRSDPIGVLKDLKSTISDKKLHKNDMAWIVVDLDSWKEEALDELYEWSRTSNKYGLAVSNPKFEYWLLLHFEKGNGIRSSRNCDIRLKKYLKDYDKNIEIEKLRNRIYTAVRNAKEKDVPRCLKWPPRNGSTVYRLMEIIKLIEEG